MPLSPGVLRGLDVLIPDLKILYPFTYSMGENLRFIIKATIFYYR